MEVSILARFVAKAQEDNFLCYSMKSIAYRVIVINQQKVIESLSDVQQLQASIYTWLWWFRSKQCQHWESSCKPSNSLGGATEGSTSQLNTTLKIIEHYENMSAKTKNVDSINSLS